ncbi:Protein OS-9 [Coccidioides posadasii str. Silveira]|uniref:Endoplasmic reticulum lectin n=2 Tax=Coccidioides posadasii TaxID=199306 RepID=E9CTK1_COCPS|nr:hypothetical protein CPC735_038610 [Coccidioides posadasii C735 delta SOWgp]EER28597.1 hypothetical protein CPC735_038610 [Coccidioides posadasii C735 delta SOWgp]EFW22146.1 misfolded glycoproteins degradation protein Yos9 [Coccidioides posadasii str. Silveira]QVM06422.1 Protein OS-9 [Coccidioides posadasii str. Silveira]|eukprot:XP_003070742.1 hypothetical protein CPC735_038610 [Coccidioides posadasii C735 delta SOWgp]
MGRRTRVSLVALIASAAVGALGEKPFRVQDDVLGFPQYEIQFPDEYILADDAYSRLSTPLASKPRVATSPSPSQQPTPSAVGQDDYTGLSQQILSRDDDKVEDDAGSFSSTEIDDSIEAYKEMVIGGQRFLCGIPKTKLSDGSASAGTRSAADQEKELARATNRGLELLQDMEGRCMYYAAGWWSYSFCYMNQVRQFHALLPGNGAPVYPPTEDPTTQSYILGRFRTDKEGAKTSAVNPPTTEVATHQADGDSWYLVQYLDDGTPCDLTGRNRKIEVQFHCHPQSTDHIGWIKEVTTCSYLMVIYTPRLCNDVAFQPPREDEPNGIKCKEIISHGLVPEWEDRRRLRLQQELSDSTSDSLPIVGDIEVGAMKFVGKDGKKIEKGRVASMGEEKVEVVAISEGGEIQRLSKEELKKYNLDPEKIEALKKQLEELANGKDWKMEMIDANGQRGLRGVIEADEEHNGAQTPNKNKEKQRGARKQEKQEKQEKGLAKAENGPVEEGSDETYKEEL